MELKLIFLLTLLLINNGYSEEEYDEETEEEKLERINTEWAFVLYDLIDYYDEYSNVRRNFLLGTNSSKEKINAELKYSRYLRSQSKDMATKDADSIPSEYVNMHQMLLKPNSAMLEDNDLLKLTEFSNGVVEKIRNNLVQDPNNTEKYLNRREYEEKLGSSRNLTYLEKIWSTWNENLNITVNFTEILFLLEKTAKLNDNYDFIQHWEDFVQYPNAYEDIKNIWVEIEPFYKEFHTFVLDRLNNYYKTNFTYIPVYLTGSKFGEDWSNLAEIILPHQQIYQDAILTLQEKSKKHVYQHCNKVAETLKFKHNPERFWKKSNFNTNVCPGEVISFCSEEYSILLTCNKTSWVEYLNTQEKSFELGLKNVDYTSLPYREIKSSFVEEGIKSLASTIAIHNMPYDDFTEQNAFSTHLNATENLFTAKLLVALRVLPKLAYYYTADTWRINEIQYPSENVVKSWWEERMKTQGVEGSTNNEPDFLQDEFIIRNEPYLGKFLGNVLQFNLLSSLDLTLEQNPSIINQLLDNDFPSVIKDIPLKTPTELVSWHWSIDQIYHYEIQSYFSSLQEYFQTAPLEPLAFVPRQKHKKEDVVTTTISVADFLNTTTPKVNVDLSRKIVDEEKESPKNDSNNTNEKTGLGHGFYILITIAACAVIIVGLLIFKRLVKMKRPRSNNRRFQA
ncbi:angiotensin-converting enzyme-like [Onthophagus taurus]|uniref:angiotensin-converting enzyme-like n=1 Tax=Onthophagus taurus TaxID=166361 RepID=UPI000C204090|nr:angiotensin-converting enzyme-like [Onthophagus taurus]